MLKIKVSKAYCAGIFVLGLFVFPQQAYACSWWDLPCKLEEAIRAAEEEFARGVEMALRVAREAASVAAQRVADEAEELAREGVELSISEANSLARDAENVYSSTSTLVKQEYNVVREGIESEIARLENAVIERLLQNVKRESADIITAVDQFEKSINAEDVQALNKLQRDVFSKKITTQTISVLKKLLSRMGISIPSNTRTASLPGAVKLGAWVDANSAVGSNWRDIGLRKNMMLASLTVPHIESPRSAPWMAAEEKSTKIAAFDIRTRYKSAGIGFKFGFADGVGGDVVLGVVLALDGSDQVAFFWQTQAVVGGLGGAVAAPSLVLSRESPSDINYGVIGISADNFTLRWDVKAGMSGWSNAVPSLSIGIKFRPLTPGLFEPIKIFGGYRSAKVLGQIGRRPSPPASTVQVELAAEPSCGLTSNAFQLLTNTGITGVNLPMIAGGNNSDTSTYVQGAWTPIANQFWRAIPAGKTPTGACT